MSTHTFVILSVCFASVGLADDFRTTKGKEYRNATVSRVEPNGIVIKFKGGIVKILFTELPKDVQLRFGYDTDKIEAEQEKRIEEQRAAEEKRIDQEKAAERERAEKEKNAETDLKRVEEEFQAAEQRASRSYQSAQKGTLSGQVFVSTSGGENFKLGAVQVGLFARDAIDALLAALKLYADNRESYYSGSFYFGYLQSPIQTAETDAKGKFVMNVPKQGSFVLGAKAARYVGQIFIGETPIDRTEHYYWLQPVSLEGQQQLTQNLSNNNLTSTTGTSSLILTKD